MVSVVDYRGEWQSSPLQFHAEPVHTVSVHALYPSSLKHEKHEILQTIRHALPIDTRLRGRFHRGSPLELNYALRSFGIDLSDHLFQETAPCSNENEEHDESIKEDIRQRQQLDEGWRQSEAPFRESKSPIAMFPNPQDIIMGRSRTVASTWPGNILYHKLIQEHVHRYTEAQTYLSGRINKTLIAVEVLHKLHHDHKSRFLSRDDNHWTVIDDSEAQVKISQALRMLAREIVHQKG